MKHFAVAATVVCLTVSPLSAEEGGTSLMEEGAKLFLKGILQEMEPAMRELESLTDELEPALRSFAGEMGPALRELFEKVEDWSLYHPPEILPNGDIILRKRQSKKTERPGMETEGEIEL